MQRCAAILLMMGLSALPAGAADFAKVSDKSEFMSLVDGRELRIGLYNLSIRVRPDGSVTGKALGWGITGSWAWKDGYFCRELDWSGMEIPYNCQLVEARGAEEMRFTVDKGTGNSASFRLR